MKQISYAQFIMLLFIVRSFKTMMYNPFENTSAINVLLEIVISTAIQSILVIPFIYIYKKYKGDNILSLAYKKGKIIGIITSALYTIYFFILAFRLIKNFAVFMSHTFNSLNNDKTITIILILVGLYGALMGLESISRSSGFVFIGLCVMFLVVIFTSKGNVDIYNIMYTPKTKNIGLYEFSLRGIANNIELPAIAIIISNVKDRFTKGIYYLLALKMILIGVTVFFIVAVLGAYVELCEIPFFKIGAYSKTQFVQRLDPLYMVEWTFCAVITVSLFIYLITNSVKKIYVKANTKVISLIVSVFLILSILVVNIEKRVSHGLFDRWLGAVLLILFVFVIPLFLAITSRKKNKEGV